jgi:hypothetical protein
MKKAYVVTGLVTVLAAIGTQACTLGSDTYITAEPGDSSGNGADAGSADGQAPSNTPKSGDLGGCSGGTFTTPDLAKLTACGDGKGHCYDKAKTPRAEMFGACPSGNEVCVPDEVLLAGGKPLKTCKAIIGNGGGCITMSLIPAMEADPRAKQFLTKDVCDDDQICAPCINPEANNASTGMCDPTGVYGECTGGGSTPPPAADGGAATKPLPACCTHGTKSSGVCIGESSIPEGERDDAPQDSCSSGNKCVPKAMVEGKTVTCRAGLLGKGVCLDTCFNEMMGFASMIGVIGKDICADTEICAPCTFMSGKGVPGCE